MKNKANWISFWSLIFLTVRGIACPCDTATRTQEYIDASNQIFVGKVIGVNSNWISGGMKYSFEVEKTWKRGSDKLMVVNTGWDYECGFSFVEGKTYLVYGIKKFSLRTDTCMGTKAIEAAAEDLRLLGEGQLPRKSTMGPMVGWAMGAMVLLFLAFFAFVILKKKKKDSS